MKYWQPLLLFTVLIFGLYSKADTNPPGAMTRQIVQMKLARAAPAPQQKAPKALSGKA